MSIFTTHLSNNTNVLLQSRHSCPWPAMLIMMGLCAGSTKLDYGAFLKREILVQSLVKFGAKFDESLVTVL